MPLHGKIVVLKRSGGDGTEFPFTATCLFGRNPDSDIRIQLPHVSKEHCRVDLNENKEVIVTNLSSVNPTCVNGQALQQSERLKHGDVITIVDRSFRFEYPPPPTPKKRSSVGGKAEVAAVDPHLKDGANTDNIQRSQEKTQELESKEDASLLENKSASPFSDLYQMIKQSLDVKTPRKSSVSVLQTPSSKFCTPKPESARKKEGTPKKMQTPISPVEKAGDASVLVTPKSAKKRRSDQLPTEQNASNTQEARSSETPPRRNATPQKFTLSEAVEQIAPQTPKSPRRRSNETTSPVSAKKHVATPKSSEKEKSKKRKSSEVAADLPAQEMKRKRVSFGGHLSPELFDKRLPPDSPLRKGATPRRSLSLYKPKQSLLRRASVSGFLMECDQERHLLKSPKAKSPAKMKTPSPKKTPKAASPKTPPSAKKSPKTPSPKSQTPSPTKKSPTPKKASPKSPKAQLPAQKAQSPKAGTPKSKTPSPGKKAATPKKASPKAPSPKTTPNKSPIQSKSETPKDKPQSKSTPKGKSPARTGTPANSPVETPKVQGRFSVSRINTPSPVAEDAAPSATPKIPLKRKSMKSSTKVTPALKSATKVMRRKSGLMRSSMKVMTSWADIVRFGKAKVQVGVPARAQVTKKTVKKKAGPKPQTPKRRLVDQVSTGHAASPATIVVGRAHRLRVAHSAGAPPKVVTNTAVLRKNMKMDEDLTGLSEMFKTPKNENTRSAKIAPKTPQTDLSTSIVEPSVLNTPEETGEMVVSPMSVASTVKGRRYNSEAVQRLLSGEESFASENPSLDMPCETSEQGTEVKVAAPKTPKQKIPMPEGLTGVKRMMKTPKQKAEPIEDLRGKLLKTPKQKSEQQECLSAVKRIMKTPKEKAAPVDDLRGKLLKTPKQKIQQQEECLTGVKRIMKTPKEKAQPVEDLRGRLLKTPKQKVEQQECLSAIKMLMKTPDQKTNEPENITGATSMRTPKQKTEQPECLTGVETPEVKSEPIDDIRGKLLNTPKQRIEQQECLTGVKRVMATPKQKNKPVEDMVGVKRLMKTPKEKVQPVEKNFGIKRLMRSPRLRGTAPVEDFEGLEELMKEPVENLVIDTEETVIGEQQETIPEQVEKVTDTEEIVVGQPESTSISPLEETEMPFVVECVQEEVAPKTKSVRGRRAKTAEPSEKNKQAQPEETEAPVRAKRGRKAETPAPPQTARSRSAKTLEEPVQAESAPEPPVKQRRGRVAKKSSKELPEEAQSVSTDLTAEPQAESEHVQPSADQKVEQVAVQEQPVVKQRRGRKNKADEIVPEQTIDDLREVEKVIDTDDIDVGQPETTSICPAEGTEMSSVVVESVQEVAPKAKCVRGRRAKPAELSDENKHAQPEETEAPVRTRRGRKAETSVPQQTARSRSAKTLEEPVKAESAPEPPVKQRRGRVAKKSSVELSEEAQAVSTASTAEPQTESEDVLPSADQEVEQVAVQEEPLVKPRRGRKKNAEEPCDVLSTAQTAKEKNAEMPADILEDSTEKQKKPARGKKAKLTAEQEPVPAAAEDITDVSEETVAPLRGRRGKKTEAPPAPAVKQKRGRAGNAQEKTEDKVLPEETQQMNETNSEQAGVQTCVSESTEEVAQEKTKRGRKIKAPVEPEPEIIAVEDAQPEISLPRKKTQKGRKAKIQAEIPQPETKITVEEECPSVCEAVEEDQVEQKTRRGRRAKAAVEPSPESEITAESVPVEETQPEQAVPAEKPKRLKRVRTTEDSSSTEVSRASVPDKRSRTAKQDPKEKSVPTEPACEPKSTASAKKGQSRVVPNEPVKRGRRAVKTASDIDEAETKDQDNSTKESSDGIENTKTSKKSVKWNSFVEVKDVTPLKTVRGRKTKAAENKVIESREEPQIASNPEENLSEKTQPAKRARRGAKAADESTNATLENKDTETQTKSRKGRSARK